MDAIDKLRATWSKRETDVMLHFPNGQGTKCDAHWLSGVFNKEFIDELFRRGYDPTTMRFSVEPQKGNQRFVSQQDPPSDERGA